MDFCLESSQMFYMPLKGLRLLRPFRDELWLVTVIPDDFQSASKELFAFSCSIFLFSLFLTPCLTFSSVPSLFSSSLSSPLHSCAVTDLLMHARSGGSHAVLTIWDGQLLQSCGVSRSTLSAGTQPPHLLPDSRFSPRVLPFCWPQTPHPQLRKVSKVPWSQGSNSSVGKPYSNGFTPSPPSHAPCGTREKARKIWECWSFQFKCSPLWTFFFLLLKYTSD